MHLYYIFFKFKSVDRYYLWEPSEVIHFGVHEFIVENDM